MVAALADDSANGFKGGAADPAPCSGLQATQDLPVTARIRADSRNGGTFVLAELPSQSDEVFGIHADTSTHFTDGKKTFRYICRHGNYRATDSDPSSLG